MSQNAFKNHYKILDIPRSASTKDIKNKTKELLEKIKKSNLELNQKKKLMRNVHESYKFLCDYHLRKSLDDQLDSNYEKNYKIINESFDDFETFNDFPKVSLFKLPFENFFNSDFEIPKNTNGKTYFYSKSSVSNSHMDKNGNIITKTKETINDNGKTKTNEYENKVNNKTLKDKKLR